MFEIGVVVWRSAWWRLVWRLAWRVFFFFFGGCCGQCLGLVVVWYLSLVVAWWPVSCGCCDGFLVVPDVAKLWL